MISEADSHGEEGVGAAGAVEEDDEVEPGEKSVGLGEGDLVSDAYLEIKPLLEPGETIQSIYDCRRVQV